ncbi:DUF839 domain-containing protein [Ancylobacter sp. WKF20]|uniref:alkaline phosphatase PhoX n=1 Tax=Ancylobacter sp. WKF20 TaxID=3039801 RepID=UPI0024341126|nr:alkaline phosphatase PhoX [Ancylobacter sp. WKF20]WGD30776.1 DUF839 domain-containing protein [Ancylobacter sp. WKF20]
MPAITSRLTLGILFALAGTACAQAGDYPLSSVPGPIAPMDGYSAPNVLSRELMAAVVASGDMALDGATEIVRFYGYQGHEPFAPKMGDMQSPTHNVEATKTEPDKNTYLVLAGQTGADPAYDYGTHFLFQGHESAITVDGKPQGYITRINLDADAAHRVTLLAARDVDGQPLQMFDGSTWNPFTRQLLFTAEEGKVGGVWLSTVDYPAKVVTLHGVFGHAAYEGVQVDRNGTIWLVEDEGGKTSKTITKAKQPNSFVYRLVPKDAGDLSKGGRLEALQYSAPDGTPVSFHPDDMDGDITAPGLKALHSYGTTLKAKWIVIHDTDRDGTEPFDANAAAKKAGASPFKRPENGVFRPGTNFTEFYFTETGDTNAKSAAGREQGGFGALLKIKQASADANEAELSMVFLGDVAHTGLDNISFWNAHQVAVVEDAGDTLHAQRSALDSGYLIDVTADYAKGAVPLRFLAEGRDLAATIDADLAEDAEQTAYQNEGDNEITGIHVSDGDASVAGLFGTKAPTPFANGWRVFFTQQHGLNQTWEILPKN